MAGMSVDGLVSGLDTTSLINQLMSAEAAPQTALRAKVTLGQAVVAAYQSVNTRFAALQSAAELLGKAETWTTPGATSSSTKVAVTASSTALAGQVSFDVTALAKAHSVATGQFATLADIAAQLPPVLTGTKNGVAYTITSTDNTTDGLVAAINAAKDVNGDALGVTASVLQVSPGQYRLQITATDTGAADEFTVAGLGATIVVRQGADAKVDLGGGLVVSSSTNTFTGVLPGTSFTVSQLETGVTVTAAVDPKALADKVDKMVAAANSALADITRLTAYDSTTRKASALTGDHTVRELQQKLLGNVSGEVGSAGSPGAAGLGLDRFGHLTFDREKFLALQASDPAKAQELVQGVADRLAAVADGATDSEGGTLTLAAQGRSATVKDLGRRIDEWDTRLTVRKAALSRQFSAMETALSGLKSQSSWLAGQISSLPTSSS